MYFATVAWETSIRAWAVRREPRRSPEYVRSANVADQLSNLPRRPRSSDAPPTALHFQ